ncbi:DUF7155 family protein [[Mycobacterium] burgundiense]|uniref:Uncharacterized protein n=1 Tax=[Mycobacterium] burgundiense TaxID=3064286 RepID=A0ABN9NBK0_9MYCO|nr:hypothetical protein [Mycolicibacterium sp. MU0053]CAJ1500897.1 hypothetical protein MU0053_001787 [Mycolicibacterium sp. MU0053]
MARTRQFVAGFAIAGLAVAAPTFAALSTPAADVTEAAPACLAWLGSMNDGKCISYSMGSAVDSSLNGIPITINGPVGDAGINRSRAGSGTSGPRG